MMRMFPSGFWRRIFTAVKAPQKPPPTIVIILVGAEELLLIIRSLPKNHQTPARRYRNVCSRREQRADMCPWEQSVTCSDYKSTATAADIQPPSSTPASGCTPERIAASVSDGRQSSMKRYA